MKARGLRMTSKSACPSKLDSEPSWLSPSLSEQSVSETTSLSTLSMLAAIAAAPSGSPFRVALLTRASLLPYEFMSANTSGDKRASAMYSLPTRMATPVLAFAALRKARQPRRAAARSRLLSRDKIKFITSCGKSRSPRTLPDNLRPPSHDQNSAHRGLLLCKTESLKPHFCREPKWLTIN